MCATGTGQENQPSSSSVASVRLSRPSAMAFTTSSPSGRLMAAIGVEGFSASCASPGVPQIGVQIPQWIQGPGLM